jgi:cellulose synthase/poly-beta-1,6-N-acetylglucosamine synthase-like glycosyltransferase
MTHLVRRESFQGERGLPVIDGLYVIAVVLLATYGLNALVSVALYLIHRNESRGCPDLVETPPVTVQLPVYNEMFVLERLLSAVVALEYPRDRLHIQVLDDSTDATTELAERLVKHYSAQGVHIDLIHRDNRSGFKAGALKEGSRQAKGEYIAIFDADFVPEPDFLLRTVPHFLENSNLGLIQTRWGHINADYSNLTRAQAIALDGHFVVEQTARNRSGLFMNFNGTAGVWRKTCIEAAGGWQDGTICEDLDLSYRAQLEGWDFLYVPDVVVPAELPPQINAFKRQQFRWAKGSMQVALKLGGRLIRADVPWYKRLQGMLHLTNYGVHPLMVLLLLSTLPLLLGHSSVGRYIGFLSLASLGPPVLYGVSQRVLHGGGWLRRFSAFPLLVLLGTGIAWNNTRAIWEAFTGRKNEFLRTPKFHVEGRLDKWNDNPYALSLGRDTLGELGLAAYAAVAIVLALRQHNYFVLPFLLLYVLSFSYVAVLGIVHSMKRRQVNQRFVSSRAPVKSPKPSVISYSYSSASVKSSTLEKKRTRS